MMDKVRRMREITNEEGVKGGLQAIKRFLEWHAGRALNPILKWRFERQYGHGIDIIESDWDNLIILDACRYDVFKNHSQFEGNLKKVVSKGYNSWTFQFSNFAGKNLLDTIYVTANPYSPRISQGVFFRLVSVLDAWNEQSGAVLPQSVTNTALAETQKYPNKRLIVHYMQPHEPHIGDYDLGFDQVGSGNLSNPKDGMSVWDANQKGIITDEELRLSYVENLRAVETDVQKLVNQLPGKTVISADHGENLGERLFGMKIYSHKYQTPQCRFVPWLELDYDSRRDVTPSDSVGDVRPGQQTIENRLEDLGYTK